MSEVPTAREEMEGYVRDILPEDVIEENEFDVLVDLYAEGILDGLERAVLVMSTEDSEAVDTLREAVRQQSDELEGGVRATYD